MVCCIVWGGSVLRSHKVPCGVLCFHVVWLVGLVEWCVGCLAGWVVWQLRLFVGCLSGCGMLCGVCNVLCGVVCCCVLFDVMSVSTHVFAAISREGGGAGMQLIFLC